MVSRPFFDVESNGVIGGLRYHAPIRESVTTFEALILCQLIHQPTQ